MTDYRQRVAKQVREAASQMAFDRRNPVHESNGDEQRLAVANYAMSFTKGLEHLLEERLFGRIIPNSNVSLS